MQLPASSAAHQTIPTLDGYRAIAISIVMLSHVGLQDYFPGQFGVTLFFFLSGYLITTLLRQELLRDGTIDLAAFYLRRVVRIFPPMYIAIGLAVAMAIAGLIPPLHYAGLAFDVTFLSNYFPVSSVPIGLWSLAVEEHFYLLFPISLLVLSRHCSARAVILSYVAVCLVILAVRFWHVANLADYSHVNFWTHTRLDSILMGSILALWNNPVIDPVDRLPKGIAAYGLGMALLVACFVFRDEAFRQSLRYSVQGLGLMLLFNASIRDRGLVRAALENAPMRFVALLSYTLYLVHGIFAQATKPLAGLIGKPLAYAAGIALSFAFAWGVHLLVEKPLAAWRRGVEKRRRLARTAGLAGRRAAAKAPN